MTTKEKQILKLILDYSEAESRQLHNAEFNKDIQSIIRIKRSADKLSALAYTIACILSD